MMEADNANFYTNFYPEAPPLQIFAAVGTTFRMVPGGFPWGPGYPRAAREASQGALGPRIGLVFGRFFGCVKTEKVA